MIIVATLYVPCRRCRGCWLGAASRQIGSWRVTRRGSCRRAAAAARRPSTRPARSAAAPRGPPGPAHLPSRGRASGPRRRRSRRPGTPAPRRRRQRRRAAAGTNWTTFDGHWTPPLLHRGCPDLATPSTCDRRRQSTRNHYSITPDDSKLQHVWKH